VRIENALDYCGHCAIDTIVEASSREELLNTVNAFMDAHGFQSHDIGLICTRAPDCAILVGLHWRIEEIARQDGHHGQDYRSR
jgi:hypothetical protein